MKNCLLFAFLYLLCSVNSFSQKNKFIFIGYEGFNQTQKFFSLKKENYDLLKYGRGNFVTTGLIYKPLDNFLVKAYSGIGRFKPHKYIFDTVEYLSSSIQIPLRLEGAYLFKSRDNGLGIIGGVGIQHDKYTQALFNGGNSSTIINNYFSYHFGLFYMVNKLQMPMVLKYLTFDKNKFIVIELQFNVFSFPKKK